MTNPLARHTVVFVIRMWAEYFEEKPPCWRGEIECVDTGSKICFHNPQEIERFLQTNTLQPSKFSGGQ